MQDHYDVAVVGSGMIGASAARYLSATGVRVAAIGPVEPADWQTHLGVFSSHYDEARITRIIDPDPVWAKLGARSIASYAEIEETSGIRFHYPVGCLRVSPHYGRPDDTLAQSVQNGVDNEASFQSLTSAELVARFPYLSFDPGSRAFLETGGAGYINPRALVAAQQQLAAKLGARLIRETVTRIRPDGSGVELLTGNGTRVLVDRVLLTTGAFTNFVLPRPLMLHPRIVTVLLADIDYDERRRLARMPSIIYRLTSHPTLFSIYCLPPVRYPDGRVYFKIGGPLHTPNHLYESEELVEWFHGAGDNTEIDALHEVLRRLIPDLRAQRYVTKPCVVTYTSHERPYIDLIGEKSPASDRVYVAAGGCGAAAKSSVEIGRIAARMVSAGTWRYDMPADWFRAHW